MTVCEIARAIGEEADHIYDICRTCAYYFKQCTDKPCNRCVRNPEHEIGTTALVDEYVPNLHCGSQIPDKKYSKEQVSKASILAHPHYIYQDICKLFEKYKMPKDIVDHSQRVRGLCDAQSDHDPIMGCTGLAHDLLEDTDCTYNRLKKINLIIADNVLVLTRKEDESYADYIKRVKAGNDVVRKVKIVDIMDHLVNYETLKESLKERYLDALKTLLE